MPDPAAKHSSAQLQISGAHQQLNEHKSEQVGKRTRREGDSERPPHAKNGRRHGGRAGSGPGEQSEPVGPADRAKRQPHQQNDGPGILLELASIRQAIEEGLDTFDLGPGDYRYKHELGGDRTTVLKAEAASPEPHGPAIRALTDAYVATRWHLGNRRRIRAPAAEAARNTLASGSSLAHMLPVRGLRARSSSSRGLPRSAAERSASSHR